MEEKYGRKSTWDQQRIKNFSPKVYERSFFLSTKKKNMIKHKKVLRIEENVKKKGFPKDISVALLPSVMRNTKIKIKLVVRLLRYSTHLSHAM